MRIRLFALVLVSSAGCDRAPVAVSAPAAPDTAPLFRDVTAPAGIDFRYRNGEEADHFAILESLGGGVALFDYDRDGDLDIFATGGGYYDGPDKKAIKGHPGKMYRNDGGLKFTDVTNEVGLGDATLYTHGAAAGDYDNDGFPDLLVTGYGRSLLFRNLGGKKFADVTDAAKLTLGRHFWGTSAAWADFDGDGLSDLYVCQYVNWSWENHPLCPGYAAKYPRDVCPPKQYQSVPHALFRNNGDGTFRDVTAECGIRLQTADKDYGKGLGVLACDVNGDRKPDLYVCNDTTDNFLYVNRSTPGKIRFDDVGFNLGVARDGGGIPNGSMGVDAADYDGSGRPSIWVTNYENEFHALYRNETKSPDRLAFTYATPAAGIGAIGPKYVGFGTSFMDVDRDGWQDIVVANGHVVRHPPADNLRQSAVLMLNGEANGRRRFALADAGPDFAKPVRSRGLAVGDLDNDGAPDLVFSCVQEPLRVLRNEWATVTPDRHWMGVGLVAKHDIVGARVRLTQGGRDQTAFAKGGTSYLSTCDRRHVFGLGTSAEAGSVRVEWPTGEPKNETFAGLKTDEYHALEQGKGKAAE